MRRPFFSCKIYLTYNLQFKEYFGKKQKGRDANGEEMLETCRKAGIHTEDVLFDPVLASGCSVIILEEKPGESTKNRIIVISGSNMSITKTEADRIPCFPILPLFRRMSMKRKI